MANQTADRPSGSASAPRAAREPGTFPAGAALLALGVSFVMLRITARVTRESVVGARIAVGAGVLGALLATVALFNSLMEGARGRGARAWGLAGFRVALAAPLAVLMLRSMVGETPEWLKWYALYGTAGTVALSLGNGIARARGLWLARVALALLLFGELVELAWPPAHLAFAPGTTWPRLTDRLGPYSELAALVGAPIALAWSIAATHRVGGRQRVMMFAPFPVLISALLSMLALQMRGRDAVAAARMVFGTRFDLLAREGNTLRVSAIQLLFYLLVPQFLLCASAISVGGVIADRGASARRTLGWAAVLIAGFGPLNLAGPMDPVRLVTVALGAVLLERAAVLEAEGRAAPA